MKRIFIIISMIGLLCGCYKNEEPVFESTIITYPPAASADFTLPEGYAFADETTAAIVRTKDHQIIGGILNTGLNPDCLEEANNEDYHSYLTSLGYMCEYISMNADGYKAVSLYITDKNAEKQRETSRSIFPKDGTSYDLWFDNAAANDDEKNAIRKSVIGK